MTPGGRISIGSSRCGWPDSLRSPEGTCRPARGSAMNRSGRTVLRQGGRVESDDMGRRDANEELSRRQPSAPFGSIPVPGETWQPVGRKALVGAAFLAPVDLVRPLVPEEFEIRSILPGGTLATVFLADYGPGSTLEY